MNIEIKNVPPIVALTHLQPRCISQLEQTAYELYNASDATGKESLFCIIDKPYLDKEEDVKMYCPISSLDLVYHEKKYNIEVLPRALVLSTIHLGEYNQLKPVFESMFAYIAKNKLNTSMDYRVIFHSEKREWDRTKLHHKPESDYITEVQIQIYDK